MEATSSDIEATAAITDSEAPAAPPAVAGSDEPRAPPPIVTEIEVSGMCCSSEVDLIRHKLGVLAGVHDIKVNLPMRRIAVTH